MVLLTASFASHWSCIDRPVQPQDTIATQQTTGNFVQHEDKDVDILFVIDNSKSMLDEQQNLTANFSRLIDALRAPQLGGALPNLRIGVTTTDLGVGPWATPPCDGNGDGGFLRTLTRSECPTLADAWIEFNEGATNVSNARSTQPIDQVKEAFSCLATVGAAGCGFEQPLEAIKLALDGRNANFLRPNALLVVVIITDEDDCSVSDEQLLMPGGPTASPNEGPDSVWDHRCTLQSVTCAQDMRLLGGKSGCRVRQSSPFLHPVDDYYAALQRLKPPGRLLVFTIAAPPSSTLTVIESPRRPPLHEVQPTCENSVGSGEPAFRLRDFTRKFGALGAFNEGLVAGVRQSVDICSEDFGPAMAKLGALIVGQVGPNCIPAPPLTAEGQLACQPTASDPQAADCAQACQQRIACDVEDHRLTTSGESVTRIARCDAAIPSAGEPACDPCPCWRINRPAASDGTLLCEAQGSPFGIEIVRDVLPPVGSWARVACLTSIHTWTSEALQQLPTCQQNH